MAALRGGCGGFPVGADEATGACCCIDAMSPMGLLGRRMPPEDMGGDCEWGSRGMENVDTEGEL